MTIRSVLRCSPRVPGFRGLAALLIGWATALPPVSPAHSLGSAATRPRPTESFVDTLSAPHYDRVRDYDVLHTDLDIRFDWDRHAVQGTVTHRLAPFRDDTRELHFDQHRMEFSRISLSSGTDLTWRTLGDTLTVTLDRPYARGEELELTIAYEASEIPTGVFFLQPTDDYPDRPWQIWTQGESEDNHFWVPCYDNPNERMTTDERITVARRFTALGNGEQVEVVDNADGTLTWHFREDSEYPPYLMAFVVGEYQVYEQSWNGIPIESYVRPSRFSLAERSFSRTADMMEIFTGLFGVPYPYSVYRQVEVEEYLFAGMENVTLTVLTSRTLHDEIVHETYGSEGLVSHELAHQWWGDFVSPRNWASIWLSEGFATYGEVLFYEQSEGVQRARWENYSNQKGYLAEDQTYRRPMVTRYYDSYDDLFDGVAYGKGGNVLHMLRRELGDAAFFDALREFLTDYGGSTVETSDFRRTVERVSGRSMDRFFAQWVDRGGHPEFAVSWNWEAKNHMVRLGVNQTQPVDELTPLFDVPVTLDLTGPGFQRRIEVRIDKVVNDFYVEAPERPDMVEFDREGWTLMEVSFAKPEAEWVYQLQHSPEAVSRARAAEALGRTGSDDAVSVLEKTVWDENEFWGVRETAAEALGEQGGSKARRALIRALVVENARTRTATAEALAGFEDRDAVSALEAVARNDQSPHVVEAALKSLGAMGDKRALGAIRDALGRESWEDLMRRAALEALGRLGDEAGIDIAIDYTGPPQSWAVRAAALGAVAALGAELEPDDGRVDQIRKVCEKRLDDDVIQVRTAAARALGTLGSAKARAALERAAKRDDYSGFLAACRSAVKAVGNAASAEEKEKDLKQQVSDLNDRNLDLESDLMRLREEMEALRNPRSGP